MKLKPLGANRNELTLADGTKVLFSYETPVAAFVPGCGHCRTTQNYSPTTSKHIAQWLTDGGALGAREVPQSEIDALVQS